MKLPVLIRVYYKDELTEVKQFTENQIVFGRADSAQVHLNNSKISPLHALIEERDNGYYVADLGAESGIFKDNKKILDEKLESGDEIMIGPYKVEFYIGVPKPKAPPSEEINVEGKISGPPPVSEALDPSQFAEEKEESEKPPEVPTEPVKLDLVKELHAESEVELEAEPESGSKDSVPEAIEADKPVIPEKFEKIDSKKFPYKKKFTLAPKNSIKNLDEHLKVGLGKQIEILVAWNERVIDNYFFENKNTIKVGSRSSNDVICPFGISHKLITFSGHFKINLAKNMKAQVIQKSGSQMNKSSVSGPAQLELKQSELIKIEMHNSPLVLYVRHSKETIKPIAAPLFDLNLSDLTALVFALIIGSMFGLYMFIYAPVIEEEPLIEETLRRAVVKFAPPKVVRVPIEKIKVKKNETTSQKKKKQTRLKKVDPGKAKAVAPTKRNRNKKKVITSARPGGAKKTGKKSGAGAKSVKKDPTKVGLLGALSGRGIRKKLDKSFSGSGELLGLADDSTGFSGVSRNRPGVGIGTSLKSVGKSGKGTSTQGIGDIKVGGKGKSFSGLGTGVIGKRAKLNFQLGGDEEDFVGRIDRDAVRRVILANKSAFRFCYNKQLKSNSSLFGKLILQWDIIEGGRVRNVVVKKNTIGNKKIAKCVGRHLKGLKFPEPPPESEATVLYPFVFSSQ